MQPLAVRRPRMKVWICAAVVPIWPAPEPVWKTLVRIPAVRRALAYYHEAGDTLWNDA
jgi:hypothetical protein